MTSPQPPTRLSWAVASTPLEDGASGDLHVVLHSDTHTLLCVIDGLGHGPNAKHAAVECASILRAHAGCAILDLFRCCHAGLRETRGVVMTAALIDESTGLLDWAGVGNVEGVVWRPSGMRGNICASVVARGGVVGFRLPPLKSSQVALAPGDIIVLVTDGVHSDFTNGIDARWSADELANELLRNFSKTTDDALVLVASYGGAA
jgi:phosphoserine phosphatase RsbX